MESIEILPRQVDAVLECLLQHAKVDATEGGTFDTFVQVQKWADVGFGVAQDAAAVLVNYVASLSKAEAAKTIVWMALVSIAIETTYNEVNNWQKEVLVSVGKVNIPASGFATKPPKDEGCKGDEPITKESPICLNLDCLGSLTGLYTTPLKLKCPCIPTIPLSPGAQPWDQSWTDFQQQWLLDVNNGVDFGSNDTSGQQIAVASYINPGGDPNAWNRLLGYPSYKISILVANVMNGPDSVVAPAWTDVITRGISSGKMCWAMYAQAIWGL
ncbi:hypothetical protein BKA64DRAFT_757734 [Cadophora sp. MPI-SDFR-AT-0126]|nr:hypothetical protein BKA64DRAFT_757734 [Leotiomycetes sp. MPI-SDFR-AT-0126]